MKSEVTERWRGLLARERGPRYWRSLEELSRSPEFEVFLGEEFPRLEPVWRSSVSRRDTLRLMAASMALGGLAACQKQPQEHLVPYVMPPEEVVPGNPVYYATASVVAGYAHGLMAESHEGRPTKVEGLPAHPANLGASDSASQASVLSLYDPDRSQAVRHGARVAGVQELMRDLAQRRKRWDRNGGEGLRLLTATVTSPSQSQRILTMLERWPQARWHAFEPLDRRSVYTGASWLLGRSLEPIYHFAKARVVVSLDADFLTELPGFVRYSHDFMSQRRPLEVETDLARLYTAESTPGNAGAVADHVVRRRFDQIEALARQLARALDLDVAAPAAAAVSEQWVRTVAADLQRHSGAALVVPGDRQPPAVHAIAHAMNHALNAPGRTMDWIEPVAASHRAWGLDALIDAMRGGEVDELIVLDANPAYTAPADLDFPALMQNVPWRLHWGEYYDETGARCQWHVPATHALEAWADARAYDGTVSLIQPLIVPLYDGRTVLQMLSMISDGREGDPRELLRSHWRQHHDGQGFEDFWRSSLRSGMVEGTAGDPVAADVASGWQANLPEPASGGDGQGLALQFVPDPAIWDGRYANNGWLQELPRPLTKLTWENALLVSPKLARERELDNGDQVRVTSRDRSIELPVYILPGQPDDAVSVNLGYGRWAAGRVADGSGANAYRLQTSTSPWMAPVTITAIGAWRGLPTTQNHHAIEGRDLIRTATVDEYSRNPDFAKHSGPDQSLYPEPWPAPRQAEHAWGMSIDLSACTGCNACITACQAENNIPIVGPEEVRRGHIMQWLRVDRYFEGPVEGPGLAFQPVPCMQCENAPCEYVCPVEATQHSAAGLNEMLYQRCIGTRYCSQNCPYKVRRFNWFNYTDASARYPAVEAVQNPDVTVRTRGVMEKCTYCVQRIQSALIESHVDDQPIPDGRIKTACQQACPTEAIVFGDISSEDSEVSKRKAHPLDYEMLGELNTRPRTTYLAAVRNPNPELREEDKP